jgi:hypothetical protein
MKSKLLFSGLIICFLLHATRCFAQDTSAVKTLPPVTVTATTKKIPGNVWYGFSKYFTEAENPGWYEINKKYLVKFMTYDKANRALFTKKGHIIYHISYGYEKNMPEEPGRQIKAAYPDHEITKAIKVRQAGREVWVINLEDAKSLVILRVEEEEMEEIQRLKKTPAL